MKYYDGSGVDPVLFLNENQDVCFLVLDETLVRPVMALQDSSKLSSQADAIRQLARSSHSGRHLFSSALKTLAQHAIDEAINTGMKELAEAVITEAKMMEKLAELNDKLAKIEGIESVQRRDVVVMYRGVRLRFQGKSPLRTAELALRCMVRGAGCQANLLESLPGEEFIAAKVDGIQVHQDMLVKAKRVRAYFRSVLQSVASDPSTGANGDEVKARFFFFFFLSHSVS